MLKKALKIAVVILILTLIVYLIWLNIQTQNLKLSRKDKDAAVKNLLGRSPRVEQAAPVGDQSYSNQYYSIIYPKSAFEYHRDKTYSPSPIELSYFAFQEFSPRLFFVITVTSHPGMTLEDYPSVSVRERQTNLYTKYPITAGGLSGLLFVRTTPDESSDLEKSAFFVKDDRIYSFSLTGSNMDEITPLFTEVMSGLKFN